MTSSNGTIKETDQDLQERQHALEYIVHDNPAYVELLRIVIKALEQVLTGHNQGISYFTKKFMDGNKLNKKLEKLIAFSPPFINPAFKEIPMKDIPKKAIEQYGELMGIEDRGSYFTIKDTNYEKSKKYRKLMFKLPFLYVQSNIAPSDYKSILKEEDSLLEKEQVTMRRFRNELYSIHWTRLLPLTDSEYENHLFEKDDFNHYFFFSLYIYHYFDYVMETFYSDVLEYIEKISNLSIIRGGTGEHTLEDLKDYRIPGSNLAELIKHYYYYETLNEKVRPDTEDMPKLEDCTFSFITPSFDKNHLIGLTEETIEYPDFIQEAIYQEDTISDKNRVIEHIEVELELLSAYKIDTPKNNLFKLFNTDDFSTVKKELSYLTKETLNRLLNNLSEIAFKKKSDMDELQTRYRWTPYAEDITYQLDEDIKYLKENIAELRESEED